MAGALASDLFRYVVLPLAAAFLASWVKFFIAGVRRRVRTAELWSVWLELMIVSLVNLLTAASDAALRAQQLDLSPIDQARYYDYLLTSVLLAIGIVLFLWLVSYNAARSRGTLGQFIWPHFASASVLVAVLLFASQPLPTP
jgi:hypothetical protein